MELIGHDVGCVLGGFFEHVRVDIQSCARSGVPQPAGNFLYGTTLFDQERYSAVTQAVKGSIEELFNEVMSDKSLRTELIKAIKAGKQEEFFKAHGCNATTQEALAFVKPKIASGELTIPDDLMEKLIWDK